MSAKNTDRRGRGDTDNTAVDNTDMVSYALEDVNQDSNFVTITREFVDVANKDCRHPLHKKMRLTACQKQRIFRISNQHYFVFVETKFKGSI